MKNDNCKNTIHSYRLEGDSGMLNMQDVMKMFRCGFKTIGGIEVESILDHSRNQQKNDVLEEPNSLYCINTIEYRLDEGSSVVIRSSIDEPEIKVWISIADDNKKRASSLENRICEDIENIVYINYRVGYCCE